MTNKNKLHHYVNAGMSKMVINFLKSGLSIQTISDKLLISYHMTRKLLYYELHKNKVEHIKTDIEIAEREEMSFGGESFKGLYLPVYEEKECITYKAREEIAFKKLGEIVYDFNELLKSRCTYFS